MIYYNSKLKMRARELRKNATPEEKKLWYEFLSGHEFNFLRQKPIDNYIVDFYCSARGLVIEIDGSQHYTEDGMVNDKIRTEVLNAAGLNVIRFSNDEVKHHFSEVCAAIDAALT